MCPKQKWSKADSPQILILNWPILVQDIDSNKGVVVDIPKGKKYNLIKKDWELRILWEPSFPTDQEKKVLFL